MVRVTKLELHRTISDIMKKGHLDNMTTKKIRILCEQKYNVDLTSRREEIDRIVRTFVAKQSGNRQMIERDDQTDSSEEESESGESESGEESSGSSESSGSESCSDSECSDSSEAEAKKPVVKVQSPPKPVPAPKKVAIKRRVVAVAKKVVSQPAKRRVAVKPVAKKMKKERPLSQAELDDAAFARRLQAEEWNFRQRTVKKLV